MKQSINLYLPEFRKEKDWLDALRMVQVLGVSVLVVALVTGFQYWQSEELNKELAVIDQQLQVAVNETAALRASFGAQSEDPVLLQAIADAEESLQIKQVILKFMTGREMGNSEGFSEYMADLARYHTQGLSLTNINLSKGGTAVTLAGQVLRTELVPLYLQNLSQGQSFDGKEFYTLQIKEELKKDQTDNATSWMFAVSTANGAGR